MLREELDRITWILGSWREIPDLICSAGVALLPVSETLVTDVDSWGRRAGVAISASKAIIKINFFIIIFLLKKLIKVIPYSVLLLRNQPTRPTPMLPSRIAPGAGTIMFIDPATEPPLRFG